MNKKLDPTDWVDYLLQTGATVETSVRTEVLSSTPRVRGRDTYRKKFQMLEKFPVKIHHPTRARARLPASKSPTGWTSAPHACAGATLANLVQH
jgi:hypothetical protein